MLIAQITDIHLGFERETPGEMNRLRLDQVIAELNRLDPRPELLICSGDLTDRGDVYSYERLREALSACVIPYRLVVGNHDLRANLLSVFPETPTSDGFVQYAFDQGPLRIIVLDTLEERRHAGAFGPERAAWLEARLAEAPDRPTLIVLHHPPVVTGIDWMTLVPEETWAPRLGAVVARHKQVVGAICGHMHRAITAPWAGTILRACPSTAPQVALDLRPMDLEHPDDRPLILEEPPAYALHRWTPAGLLTFYARVEKTEVLLRFDQAFQPVLKHFEEERHHEPKPDVAPAPPPEPAAPPARPIPEPAAAAALSAFGAAPRASAHANLMVGAAVLFAELLGLYVLRDPLSGAFRSVAVPMLGAGGASLVEMLVILPAFAIAWWAARAAGARR